MDRRGHLIDYDPLTGVAEYYEETQDGKFHVHSYQDVEPTLERMKEIRNTGTSDDVFRKNGVSMYASLPMIVVHQMMQKGINVFDQNHMPQVIKEIEANYPHLKATYKHHSARNR